MIPRFSTAGRSLGSAAPCGRMLSGRTGNGGRRLTTDDTGELSVLSLNFVKACLFLRSAIRTMVRQLVSFLVHLNLAPIVNEHPSCYYFHLANRTLYSNITSLAH
jgi:hypothetical protein